jgi:hypothetical protein
MIAAPLASLALACLTGYTARYLPIRPHWQSLVALAVGWLSASALSVTSWLRWSPHDVGVVAVSVGLVELALSMFAVALLGLVIHVGVRYLEGAAPWLALCHSALMGLLGGLVAVSAFAFGAGGVHPFK